MARRKVKRKPIHSEFRWLVEKKLIAEGYKILGREVRLTDISINAHYITIDLLVEKDGIIIPVECGTIQRPKQLRLEKLKEKYGQVKHIRYGQNRQILLKHDVICIPIIELI